MYLCILYTIYYFFSTCIYNHLWPAVWQVGRENWQRRTLKLFWYNEIWEQAFSFKIYIYVQFWTKLTDCVLFGRKPGRIRCRAKVKLSKRTTIYPEPSPIIVNQNQGNIKSHYFMAHFKKGMCIPIFYPSTVVKIKACGRQQRRAKSQQQQIIPLGEKHFISRNSLLVLQGIHIECVVKIQSLKSRPGQVISCQMLAI